VILRLSQIDLFAYIAVKLSKARQSLVKPVKSCLCVFRMTITALSSLKNYAAVVSFFKRISMNSTNKFALKSLAIGALALAAMVGAQAQSSTAAPAMAPGLTGVYVGGSIGSTSITDLNSKVGFGGYAGIKLNENIAIEAGAQSLGKFSVAVTDVKASAFNVSVLAGVPIDPKISVYGRLGYGSLTATANGGSADVNSALYGVGARYQLNQNLAIRAEYTRLASDTGTFGVGLQYGF
jgi:Outer membrane protein beta-barrel domain